MSAKIRSPLSYLKCSLKRKLQIALFYSKIFILFYFDFVVITFIFYTYVYGLTQNDIPVCESSSRLATDNSSRTFYGRNTGLAFPGDRIKKEQHAISQVYELDAVDEFPTGTTLVITCLTNYSRRDGCCKASRYNRAQTDAGGRRPR